MRRKKGIELREQNKYKTGKWEQGKTPAHKNM